MTSSPTSDFDPAALPSAPRVIAIAGMPGAGKSTTAALLAARLPRAAHVEADVLQQMILGGGEWPAGGPIPSEEAARQLRLRLHNACLLARSFVDAGFTAVVDDILIGSRIDDLLQDLEGVPLSFVMLTPDYELVRQRWIAINSPFADTWAWIDETIRTSTRRLGLWLDPTTLTPDQVANEILRRLPEATVTL
ncbi:MAG: AAA family ATPase [Chloroflexi bacterium]|nr:AAA family ATPase [Chloroflexota bacterium]MDA1147200.1 AAA family ATPase [Chloroflexota bacterium]